MMTSPAATSKPTRSVGFTSEPETRHRWTHAGSTPTEWSASDNGVPWAAAQSRKEASGRRSVKGTSRSDTSPLLLSFMTYG
ncbi:MAG: hypothetical protein HXK03_08775 [Schaalia georgiae]|uniref:Uncharacterized protein n=1 Tax=Schaalia georgiae TaxID=52768 RepID=A0A929N0J3_9ACTO|nr:hypothetical protein [Schaalia georgiae]